MIETKNSVKSKVPFDIKRVVETCLALGYIVKMEKHTRYGRVHIILKSLSNGTTNVNVHNDVFTETGIHYCKQYDGTAKKYWNQIKERLYKNKS